MTPSLSLINLLECFTELNKILEDICEDMIKNTGEHPDGRDV